MGITKHHCIVCNASDEDVELVEVGMKNVIPKVNDEAGRVVVGIDPKTGEKQYHVLPKEETRLMCWACIRKLRPSNPQPRKRKKEVESLEMFPKENNPFKKARK